MTVELLDNNASRLTLVTRTLDELANIANVEHEATIERLESAVPHAIGCGAALLEARSRVPHGEWVRWMDDHLLISHANAQVYMRLAECAGYIGDAPSIRAARRIVGSLSGGPAGRVTGTRMPPEKEDDLTRDARELRKQGLSYEKIGQLLGVNRNTIARRLDPKRRKHTLDYSVRKKRESRIARQALAREHRDKAVKQAGGPCADAYAFLRRSVLKLDQALSKSTDSEERAALRSALSYAHRAEDDIVKALRIDRRLQSLPVVPGRV